MRSRPKETEGVLIVGTGAQACLFGGRLAAAGVRVAMLGTWPEGLEALERAGVRVVQPDGAERVYPVRATSDPAACAGTQHALVLVKSWQTERAGRQLGQCLGGDGVALTLQNGLGNRETLVQALGDERVALGVTTTGATLLGPGRVRAGGEGPVTIGAQERVEPLAELLEEAGFEVRLVAGLDELVWGKLVINAAINPLTALLGVPNGELLRRPQAREMMAAAAKETASVATALGINLEMADPVAAAEEVARRTASNHSSMLQDVRRGAPTEIDAICGGIVEAGKRAGVLTPVNHALWCVVKALRPDGGKQ
jgi:2-dehydropantoate 2-reductase